MDYIHLKMQIFLLEYEAQIHSLFRKTRLTTVIPTTLQIFSDDPISLVSQNAPNAEWLEIKRNLVNKLFEIYFFSCCEVFLVWGFLFYYKAYVE